MSSKSHFFRSRTRLKQSNVISLYSFENNLTDSIGNNDGSAITNNYSPGLINQSRIFGSANEMMSVPNNINLSFTDGINDIEKSISFLFRFNNTPTTAVILNKRAGGTNNEFQIFYHSNNTITFQIFSSVATNRINVVQSFTPLAYQWYHLTATYNGSVTENGLNLFIDGIANSNVKTQTGTYTGAVNNSSLFYVGGRYDNASQFNGSVDELKIWNIELTPAETLELATKELNGEIVI